MQRKPVNKQVAAALASHQDVPTSSSNGSGGGKPRVMVIGEQCLCLNYSVCRTSTATTVC